MQMKRFTHPFRQLRGKLTLSYTLTSVVTFLFIELIFIAVVLWYVNFNLPGIILDDLKKEAPQAAPYFIHGPPDREELTGGLDVISTALPNLGPPGQSHTLIFLTVVNTQGQALASVGSHSVPFDAPISAQLSPQSWTNLQAVLHDGKGTTSKVNQEADGTLVAETPIVGNGGNVQGALIMKTAKPDIFQLLADFLQLIIVTGIIVTIIAAIAGMVFGYLTARGITRRLKRLSAIADRWSRGDFSALTHDASEDELGQMSRQLNRMAEQLQNLLQARQKLATLEERNRLARDLHDSVKQQIFAVAMQIGATKVLLKRDVAAAEVRLNEAEKLVRQAQQELTSLIRELRPVALEGKGLVVALRELATQWAQQTDIVANLGVESTEDTQTLSLTVEEALFRVAQEALANVARHSNASLVQMLLTTSDDTVRLSVLDNGQGFDTTHQGQMGVGLLSMQERMKALGGDVQVESTPGKGTRIVVHCRRLGVGTIGSNDEDANGLIPKKAFSETWSTYDR
ncbi:MAG: histidine kinase [Chloroflexota bacterium]|nr:histidine kinase [Chloroflexota bacterium]